MAKKVVTKKIIPAPKGSEIKAESKTKLIIQQLKYDQGDIRSTTKAGVKAALNGVRVKSAFRLGKNSKGDKSII